MRAFLKIGPEEWYQTIGRFRPDGVECGHHDGSPELPDLRQYEYVIVHHEWVRHADYRVGLRDSLLAAGARVVVHDPDPFSTRSKSLPGDWPFFPMETEQFAVIVDSIGDLWNIPVDVDD